MLPFPALQSARIGLRLLLWSVVSVSANAQIDFNRQVRPILAEHCLKCHGPDAEKRSGNLRLDVEAEAKKSVIVSSMMLTAFQVVNNNVCVSPALLQ